MQLDAWVLCRLYNKKNAWEKLPQSEEISAMDSMDRTPESEVQNDAMLPDFDGRGRPSIASQAFALPVVEKSCVREEDNGWFKDLELEDLQSSCMSFGASPVADPTIQDYRFQFFASPVPIKTKPSHDANFLNCLR